MNNLKMHYDMIIIGAGPAGLFAAIHRTGKGKVLLLEKQESAGKKLLISGSGQCNMTHAGEKEEFFKHYGENWRFLKPALYAFSNQDLMDFFTKRGLRLRIEPNGKVFPAGQTAKDIRDILVSECLKNKVTIHYSEGVSQIVKEEKGFSVFTNRGQYRCENVLLATGGKSYPATGSTGDGYNLALSLGHTIISPHPALSPVYIKNYRFADISGISLTDRWIYLYRENRKMKQHRGDIGFTHKGLSGPGILDFSRFMEKNDTLRVNMIGAPETEFSERFMSAVKTGGKTTIQKLIKSYEIPAGLIKALLQQVQIKPEENPSNIPRDARLALTDLLCGYPFVIDSIGGFNVAMVTAGGVPLKEVSPKTMESKMVKGLFFAGEVLDIDGDTGGYNLQAAFSTGFLSAKDQAENR